MDVVRVSVAGAITACALFGLLSTARHVHAGSPPGTTQAVALLAADILPVEPSSAIVGEPLFPPSGAVVSAPPSPSPTLYGASFSRRPRFADAPSSTWDDLIEEASRRFGLPPSWVRGVMQIESGGRAMQNGRPIKSAAGAMGLMQVMPETFAEMTRRYGLGSDPYEPRANILAGTAFLREMYDRYGAPHFLAAYNAGPGRVDDHLRSGRPLPFETQRYAQTLAPKILGDVANGPSATSPQVRDLTSAEAMRRAALSPSRRLPPAPPSPADAPLFVTAKDEGRTRGQSTGTQVNDVLFVHLAHQDQRRVDASAGSPED